jgi:hypothetical protein
MVVHATMEYVMPLLCNRGMVFSMLFTPRYYKQDKLRVAVMGLLVFSHSELLQLEAGNQGRGQFGNPVEGVRPPLKPLQRNGSEDVTVDISVCVCVIVNHKL